MFSEPRILFDIGALKQKGVQYVFLIEAWHPDGEAFSVALQANADRIMTFSPYRDTGDRTLHDGLPMTGGPFLWRDILPRKRSGYPFSIYRIRS